MHQRYQVYCIKMKPVHRMFENMPYEPRRDRLARSSPPTDRVTHLYNILCTSTKVCAVCTAATVARAVHS